MSTNPCWRCLTRPVATTLLSGHGNPAAATSSALTSLFSTSAALLATPPKRKPAGSNTSAAHLAQTGYRSSLVRGRSKSNKKKSAAEATRGRGSGSRIEPGERKAWRKRVVLSNGNALAVPGLRDLEKGTLAGGGNGEDGEVVVGTVRGLSSDVVDKLRAVEAFKSSQSWGLFRRPAVLVRKETVQLVSEMDKVVREKGVYRVVIDGERISGKSTLLLQAMAHGFLNGWTVVHIPEAQELTTACTEYAPIPSTDPVQWSHPTYLLRLLQTILKANPHIAAFPLTQSHTGFTLPPSAGNRQPTLADVINTPQDQDAAFAAFSAVWRELTQVPGRPPILFALDGLAHALRPSDYRDPAFERIHSLDFVLLRLFADLLSGGNSGVGAPVPDAWKDLGARDKLVNGAAVLAATTKGNSPRVLSVDLALARRLVEQQQEQKGVAGDAGRTDLPTREPYVKGYDDRAEAALKSVRVLPVAGLDRTEAKALMTYWARSGLLLDGRGAGAGSELVGEVDESVVTERWTVGGGGVVGEMERAVLENARMRL